MRRVFLDANVYCAGSASPTGASALIPKDVPVLAAAVASQAAFLITLDRRHFLTKAVMEKVPEVAILTPGDFLREIAS